MTLSVLDFERDLWVKLVLYASLEGDLDNLLLARLQGATGVRHCELCWESGHSGELPVGWDWANVLQREGLCEFLAEKQSVERHHILVYFDDWLCAEGLDAENGRIGVVLEQANDLVFVQPGLLWEREDREVLGLVDLELHCFRL